MAASGCDYPVWLSDDLDGGAGIDAPVIDAPQFDAPTADVTTGVDVVLQIDAGPRRACEVAPAILGAVRTSMPLEGPTFAVSGRDASLRYGVLVPPAASAVATENTTLIVADREGARVAERTLRVEVGGVAVSSGTVHALPAESGAEGFLVLGPEAIWLLGAEGAGASIALATAPSPAWQRAAGWVDADRFVFVTETPDLRLAVFDRTTGVVDMTTIAARTTTDPAVVHVEPGGVTISSVGPPSEVVVYEPSLDGTEVLHTNWDDGSLLGGRLIAAASLGAVRTWIVRSPDEFRTAVTAYRVEATGAPVPGTIRSMGDRAPITASLEGTVVAVQASGPTLVLYSLAAGTFTEVTLPGGTVMMVEPERDGERISLLALGPDGSGDLTIALSCGVH